MLRLALLASLAAACGDNATGIDTAALECPPNSGLTYDGYGQLVIEEHCMQCHANQSPGLGSVVAIRAHRDEILQAAVATTAMPADGDLTLEERRTLGEWLACGAP